MVPHTLLQHHIICHGTTSLRCHKHCYTCTACKRKLFGSSLVRTCLKNTLANAVSTRCCMDCSLGMLLCWLLAWLLLLGPVWLCSCAGGVCLAAIRITTEGLQDCPRCDCRQMQMGLERSGSSMLCLCWPGTCTPSA